jgi:hypothetical protein
VAAVIEFPDISHYQSGLSLTGAVAVIAKATQGVSYTDASYLGFRQQAAALHIPFSGYHWIDTTDPAAQARWYHDHAGYVPCMWDAEADGATVPRILAATAALKALGGHAWGAYLPHWWWQGHLGSPDLRPLTAAGLVLVSSNYTSTPGAGWVPYGGVTPTVWQFTDKRPLNGVLCDFNRYPGTQAQLGALFGGTTPTSPTEDDMANIPQEQWDALIWRDDAVIHDRPLVAGGPYKGEPNELHTHLLAIDKTLAELKTAIAAIQPGGGTAPTLQQTATAVVDEMHNRLAP